MAIAFSVLIFVLFVAAIIDAITIDSSRVRYLDKFFWIVIVILIPAIGAVLWFVVGREYLQSVPKSNINRPRRWSAPAADSLTPALDIEVQLAALEREIAADKIRALEAGLQAKREREGSTPEFGRNSGQTRSESGSQPHKQADEDPPA